MNNLRFDFSESQQLRNKYAKVDLVLPIYIGNPIILPNGSFDSLGQFQQISIIVFAFFI
jgi:hypothetical protein